MQLERYRDGAVVEARRHAGTMAVGASALGALTIGALAASKLLARRARPPVVEPAVVEIDEPAEQARRVTVEWYEARISWTND